MCYNTLRHSFSPFRCMIVYFYFWVCMFLYLRDCGCLFVVSLNVPVSQQWGPRLSAALSHIPHCPPPRVQIISAPEKEKSNVTQKVRKIQRKKDRKIFPTVHANSKENIFSKACQLLRNRFVLLQTFITSHLSWNIAMYWAKSPKKQNRKQIIGTGLPI